MPVQCTVYGTILFVIGCKKIRNQKQIVLALNVTLTLSIVTNNNKVEFEEF